MQAEYEEDQSPEVSQDTEDALGKGHEVIAELCGNSAPLLALLLCISHGAHV